MYSERGGCGWSELVKVSTDAAHVASQNEILYEGFDDFMVANDYMNWAPGVVPDLEQNVIDWDTYAESNMQSTYPAFLQMSPSERKWTTQAFSKTIRAEFMGVFDSPWVTETPIKLNSNAGSLEGWSVTSTKDSRSIYPIFGAVRIGQSGSNTNGATITTPAINSDKLLTNVATKCIVKAKIAYCATDQTAIASVLYVGKERDGVQIGESIGLDFAQLYPEEYQMFLADHIDGKNYAHHQRYYDVECEIYLKKGDALSFARKSGGGQKGFLVVGDIHVEVVPGEYEKTDFVDNGIGTEPDDTNYDVYGMGEFPISFWWAPPTSKHNYDDAKTRQIYSDMAASGINLVNYVGELDFSVAENKRIMNIAAEYGMKFIGCVQSDANNPWGFESNADRIAAIKQHFGSSASYVGEHLRDEPNASVFDELGQFTKEYLEVLPDKEVYINLFPMYAKAHQLGTTTYEEHIEQYLEKIPTKSLSYDYYGLGKNLANSYFTNLDLVREKTIARRMPFWVITQAGEVGSCRLPNEKEQRWSVWSNIAVGSKGIAYFCYWTPTGTDFDEVYYMITNDGQKTEMYDYIKRVNADINTIGKKLIHCHADGAIMTSTKYYPLFLNEGAGRTKYGPVQKVSTADNSVLCGCFRDARKSENGENYKGYKALVMSEMPNRDVNALLTLDPSVKTITFTHNNTTSTVELSSNMNTVVGGIAISYTGTSLRLGIPEGEAVLLEF